MLDGEQKQRFEQIMAAIKGKEGLSFNYVREDGQTTTHNAVYPRQLFRRGNQFYFRAYCHFPGDTRLFRLDRVQSLHVMPKREPLTRGQKILSAILVIVGILIVFMLLLLVSPKYRWRSLRRFIFTSLGIEGGE
jgi:predicted DNA-binding transcriptional regulator YafY